jgi:hypothetical protein
MRIVGVGAPAILGAILTMLSIPQIIRGFESTEPGAVANGMHGSVLPLGIGVALLLVALALARRTRLGYLLGIAVGLLLAVGGLGLILVEIPSVLEGGSRGLFTLPVVVIAAGWSVLWLLYGWSVLRARSNFAPTWGPNDPRLAIVLLALAVLTAATFIALGA